MSKNKREQLEREVAEMERKIAAVESEISELELSLQNPAGGADWESMHRQYADLKALLEGLYEAPAPAELEGALVNVTG